MEKNIGWNELSLSCIDHRIKECQLEVQRIVYLQKLVINYQMLLLTKKWQLNHLYQLLMLQIELILIHNTLEAW